MNFGDERCPNPATPAEATPDPIAELRRDFDARLDAVHHNVIEDVVFWAGHELAKLWAENGALHAEIAELRKQRDEPDLDGRLNIKRAASIFHCSEETVRRRCAAGQIEASNDRGQWRIKIP